MSLVGAARAAQERRTEMDRQDSTRRSGRRWRTIGLLGLGALVVVGGAVGIARAAGLGPMAFMHGHDPAMAHDFIEFRATKMLKKVNATDAQQQQVMAILEDLFAKHEGMAAVHRQMHQQLVAALTAPTVDRAAIEALRAEAVSRIDQASKDIAKALGDIAEVLTPAQRAQLAQLAQRRNQ
jgi:protein CpxP